MTFKYVWIFPVLVFTILPLTFVITYCIAVSNKHVVPVFPYISDTGTIPPESCIFGQLLNIGALFGCVTVYLRHRQIVEFYKYAGLTKKWLIVTSLLFMWIGYLACLGISLVANFQETSVITMHMVGAFMAFGLGLLYGYGQTFLTYLLETRNFVGMWMAHCRLLLIIFGTVLFVLMQLYGFASNGGAGSPFLNEGGTTPYAITRSDNTKYLISAFSEWGFAFCTILFFLTFAEEFRKYHIIPARMVLKPDSTTNANFNQNDVESGYAANPTSRGADAYKSRINAFPEIRVLPPSVTQARQKKQYHSSDEIYDRNQTYYGSNEPAPPVAFKPMPNKRQR